MDLTQTRDAILRLLRRHARMASKEIAERLQLTESHIDDVIKGMEQDHTIMGYRVVVNEEAIPNGEVRAIIEVEVQPEREDGFDHVALAISRFPEVHSVYLVSGRYDLRLEVVGESLQHVATFVASKLASQVGVKATATHFLLKKYKEAGVQLQEEETYERLKIVP